MFAVSESSSPMATLSDRFDKMAQWTAAQAGRASTFCAALAAIVIWAVSGPLFGWSDTWQLIINTSTTIITFLLVFLLQNTQNRDTEAIQLKLDELILATEGARNAVIDMEEMDERELEQAHARYSKLAQEARQESVRRQDRRPA